MNQIFLYPGELYASNEEAYIITLLGSCVGVAIGDPVNKIAGLNHYLLPHPNENKAPSYRFGNFAIQDLIKEVLKLGASKENLRAKVYGGANMFEQENPVLNVGQKNILLANELLNTFKIPIIESHTGGKIGRRIGLNVRTFNVDHLLIDPRNIA